MQRKVWQEDWVSRLNILGPSNFRSGLNVGPYVPQCWFQPRDQYTSFEPWYFLYECWVIFEWPFPSIPEHVFCPTTNWIIISQLRALDFLHVTTNFNVQLLIFFRPHGMLRSKKYTSLPYMHRDHIGETYFGLFDLIPSILLPNKLSLQLSSTTCSVSMSFWH